MASRRRRFLPVLASVTVVAAATIAGWLFYRYHGPTPPVQIYCGLTYGCDRLAETDQGGGLVHWVRADLTVPGVGLYVTPLDPAAVATGGEYRLRYVSTVVADDRLAAAVNGTLFASASHWLRLGGDRATSAETVVAAGVANHVDPNTYLLWWDVARTAHLEFTTPPGPAVLREAVWGIGGQEATVRDGAVALYLGPGRTDCHTAVGADPDRHLVWIACFDRASELRASQVLVGLGAKIGVLVDGGTSTAMALGRDARGVRTGTVVGNWRPVATQIGFRADPLP